MAGSPTGGWQDAAVSPTGAHPPAHRGGLVADDQGKLWFWNGTAWTAVAASVSSDAKNAAKIGKDGNLFVEDHWTSVSNGPLPKLGSPGTYTTAFGSLAVGVHKYSDGVVEVGEAIAKSQHGRVYSIQQASSTSVVYIPTTPSVTDLATHVMHKSDSVTFQRQKKDPLADNWTAELFIGQADPNLGLDQSAMLRFLGPGAPPHAVGTFPSHTPGSILGYVAAGMYQPVHPPIRYVNKITHGTVAPTETPTPAFNDCYINDTNGHVYIHGRGNTGLPEHNKWVELLPEEARCLIDATGRVITWNGTKWDELVSKSRMPSQTVAGVPVPDFDPTKSYKKGELVRVSAPEPMRRWSGYMPLMRVTGGQRVPVYANEAAVKASPLPATMTGMVLAVAEDTGHIWVYETSTSTWKDTTVISQVPIVASIPVSWHATLNLLAALASTLGAGARQLTLGWIVEKDSDRKNLEGDKHSFPVARDTQAVLVRDTRHVWTVDEDTTDPSNPTYTWTDIGPFPLPEWFGFDVSAPNAVVDEVYLALADTTPGALSTVTRPKWGLVSKLD